MYYTIIMELNFNGHKQPTMKVLKTTKYWVHTDKGQLLDTLMGNAAFIFGYDNKDIISVMNTTQNKVAFLNWKSSEICEDNDLLISRLLENSGYSAIGWAVSGSDGVEAAIRMNELYWRKVDSTKKKIVSFAPGYHGATYMARVLRGEAKGDISIVLNAPKWELVQDRKEQEYKALAKLKETLDANNDVGAVIFETMPWIAGVTPWSPEWWTSIRQICNDYNVNLILDDCVGCGGKLGPYFSQDRYNIKADMVVLGKALTGGYSPLSGVCVTSKISETIKEVYDYGHTWQPNMAGVGAALGVLNLFNEKTILSIEERLDSLGQKLVDLGFGSEYFAQGLVFKLTLNIPLKTSLYLEHGLTGALDEFSLDSVGNKKRIEVFAPAIADDEYFVELENRLISCLTENATLVK